MTAVQTISHFAQPWATLYSDSRTVSTAVMFTHLTGLILSGGNAVAADRASLRAVHAPPANQSSHLRELARAHRVVFWGLGITFASGLLLAAADVETFATMPAFWGKLGLIALLLGNGLSMKRTERALAIGIPAWERLYRTSIVSLVLWFAVLLASTVITSAA